MPRRRLTKLALSSVVGLALLMASVACELPESLVVEATTATSVTVSWEVPERFVENPTYAYGLFVDGSHNTDVVASAGVATVDGLDPGSSHEISLEVLINGEWTTGGPSVVAQTDPPLQLAVTSDRPNGLVTIGWTIDPEVLGRPVADIVGYEVTALFGGVELPMPHEGAAPSISIPWDQANFNEDIDAQLRVVAEYTDATTSEPFTGSWTLPAYYDPPPVGQRWSSGPPELLVDDAERSAAGLWAWADGNIGFATIDGVRYGFAANSGNTARWVVQPEDFLTITPGFDPEIVMGGPTFDYASGGPVFLDEPNDQLLMIFHGERHGPGFGFWAYLGLAKSTDGGASWTSLGPIIEPEAPYVAPGPSDGMDIGGGAYVVDGAFMYIYFRDHDQTGEPTGLSVARAPVADVVTAAAADTTPSFTKWDGTWGSEPGLGGSSTDLIADARPPRWWDIAYLEDHEQFVLAYSDDGFHSNGWSTMVRTSTDGLTWTPPERVAPIDRDDELIYVSLSAPPGQGAQRSIAGDTIDLYRTRSADAANRWDDAVIERFPLTYVDAS